MPERRLVFIGCEGESECGYVGLLQDMIRSKNIPVQIVCENLGRGAGDPLSRVKKAIKKLKHMCQTRVEPKEKFVFLDFDQAERDRKRTDDACRLAKENNLFIIWQRPCFEAALLRHLPQCETLKPPTTVEAARLLLREWPAYKKPMTRAQLTEKIDFSSVLRAAKVEPDLTELLCCLGLCEK